MICKMDRKNKVAILSNINTDPLVRLLSKEEGLDVYAPEGYGGELGALLNPSSALNAYAPDAVFLLMDQAQLISQEYDVSTAKEKIAQWFQAFSSAMKPGVSYFLSDAYLYAPDTGMLSGTPVRQQLENLWQEEFEHLLKKHSNLYLFPYGDIIRRLGEERAFSPKMWYMGKILHSNDCLKALKEEVVKCFHLLSGIPKKVLLLDLDNTLWKGLAGEHNITPVGLGDDGVGAAYKNFQRVIKYMQTNGVILGIVSKNNEEDAFEIIVNHPHMILRKQDFAAYRINWEQKDTNIKEIAKELNLGLDSFVFLDDSAAERMLIREALPFVTVPDLPERPEDLASFAVKLYFDYFASVNLTEEDKNKTKLYLANKQREELKEEVTDYQTYLRKLDIRLIRENPLENRERLGQLMNKTNQFNLTTKRYDEKELAELMEDEGREIFLYRVTDIFGDNGIVGAAILHYGETADIEEFTLSCRVMGRQIENAIVQDLEETAGNRGYDKIRGFYHPSEKNLPVKNLYPSLGYIRISDTDEEAVYELKLGEAPKREYVLKRGTK